jgi:hypothetical protein
MPEHAVSQSDTPWNPPGYYFVPTEMMFRPADPGEEERSLPRLEWGGDALGMLLGKTVFVGVTFYDRAGEVFGQSEFAGCIVECWRIWGSWYKRRMGSYCACPPWPGTFRAMMPGIYKARNSDVEMTNPDVGCFWRVQQEPEPTDDGGRESEDTADPAS